VFSKIFLYLNLEKYGIIVIVNNWWFMCNDLESAARNRQMIKLKQNIEGYLFIEAMVKRWPRNKRLPEQFYGEIPIISNKENLYGFHEVE